ncbi:MAG TPA: alpha/beta hydrolase, partial [Conexibacter sp.]
VRSHAMISKHLGKIGRRLERLAGEEAAAGHRETAMDLWFEASTAYANAQHTIMANTAEKQELHSSSLRAFEHVRELAPYAIERVEIAWEGFTLAGNLHVAPGGGKKPLVFFVPGCDMTKEMAPHPRWNHAGQRDMHYFVFDGPGQGESNLQGVALTSDNYEQAAVAALDVLLARPDVDAERVAVYGLSFGSFWALRIAARDERVAAVAAPWASYGDKRHLLDEESPRFKQLFAYLTQAESEAELDAIAASMTVEDDVARIACPTLLVSGEYDPRSPIDEVYELFDRCGEQTELWVFGDQHHMVSLLGRSDVPLWMLDIHALALDWLRDRLEGRPSRTAGNVLYLEHGEGPSAPSPAMKRSWL